MQISQTTVGFPKRIKTFSVRLANASAPFSYFAGLTFFAVLIALICVFYFGSVYTALAYIRGERLFLRPRVATLENCEKNTTQTATFEMYNYTGRTINLLKSSSNCSCVFTTDLPIEIPSGESRQVSFKVEIPGKEGHFVRDLFFVTDSSTYPYLLSQIEENVN
jgi:hypothetical protein